MEKNKEYCDDKEKTAEYHCKLGNEYARKGDYAKAIEEYKQAIQLKPDYADAIDGLGMAYRSLRDYSSSKKYLLEAKDIRENTQGKEHPKYATSLDDLGSVHASMGDYALAEHYHLWRNTIIFKRKTLGKECWVKNTRIMPHR